MRWFIAYLYHNFNMQADFDAAEKHANDLGVLLWSNPKRRMMAITQEYVIEENSQSTDSDVDILVGVTKPLKAL